MFSIKCCCFIMDGIGIGMLLMDARFDQQLFYKFYVFCEGEFFLQGKAKFPVSTSIFAAVQFCSLPEIHRCIGPFGHIAGSLENKIFFAVLHLRIFAFTADIFSMCPRIQFCSVFSYTMWCILKIEMCHRIASCSLGKASQAVF